MTDGPVYSHGGGDVAHWPAVAGTTTNSGRPIQVIPASDIAGFYVFMKGADPAASATVTIECNAGALDTVTFAPPADEWVDISAAGAGWSLAAGGSTGLWKKVHAQGLYWRTRIIAIGGVGTTIVSYIAAIPVLVNGSVRMIRPSYPQWSQETTRSGL